ncbi:substrate-binding domain-containing protein [Herbiconiux sp. 11R-BC]|uniref:substrate-binding domain-containing protein n=1 Tax=Herbiconiux sp. 11R-BC TaxID=3111637 RepID=UPI003C0D6154
MFLAVAAIAVTVTALTGCSSSGTTASTSATAAAGDKTVIDLDISQTVGPNGETPTPLSALTLTDGDVAKLKAGGYSADFLWHASSQFVTAVQKGATDEFGRLGISVGLSAVANMDAGTQANQVQTALASKPSAILSLPVDPTSAAAAFQPAVDAGVKLVFLSNTPAGYKQGVDYTSIVTDDLYQMGKKAAEQLGNSMGGTGTVGVIYYNANYYVTNQRDAAFLNTMKTEFPNITIVSKQGFSDATKVDTIASAMLTQNPDLGGMYVSYAQPAAEGALSALRSAGNTTTKLVTLDIDDPVIVDLAQGGNTVAVVADQAYALGKGMADAAAYGILGKSAPAFAVADTVVVTKDTIAAGYKDSLDADVPDTVQAALK